ncbi:MAG: DNA replication/repair protein RecF [Candidatus Subteraquimicrobiales bacterium]|nr:DNA replication/repair protein RecF [Candidatus Subteraquimicrobiales bacterium]
MYLKRLELINFRNYKNFVIEFGEKLNVVLGENAQGKTNVLEAIYLLSTGKSHRALTIKELVSRGASVANVRGTVCYRGRETRLKITINNQDEVGLARKENAVQIGTSSTPSLLKAVLFSPEDSAIVKGGPEKRRDFLDDFGFQLSPKYRYWRRQYGKILKQRNALLKTMPKEPNAGEALWVWDERLAEAGAHLTIWRESLVESLNTNCACIYSEIAPGAALSIKYVNGAGAKGNKTFEVIESKLKEVLRADLIKDRERGATSAGPHRDDLVFLDKEVDLRSFGSQGEQRTTALALKLAELEILKEEIGESPVLLLDDVMSELDENHRLRLMAAVLNSAQTIITSTNPGYFNELHFKEASVFEVKEGKARRML